MSAAPRRRPPHAMFPRADGCACVVCEIQRRISAAMEEAAARPGGVRFADLEAGMAGACAALFLTIPDPARREAEIATFTRSLGDFIEARRVVAAHAGLLPHEAPQ
ncbi:MAG: hypothetical protein NW215_10540 [Hyphomicrobiales bacterium]|nr:hypothetical protein [Hyphomicrobiales bacterium]